MAKKEEEGINQKTVDFYLEYVRSTRSTWNDQDLATNQRHAFYGITSGIGEITSAYREVVGYKKPINTAKVYQEIGNVSYYLARLLDELFYKHEEPFSHSEGKTVFDEVVERISFIFDGKSKLDEEADAFELALSLPCYYKDIYVGAVSKNSEAFIVGTLSLIANLSELSALLGVPYTEFLAKKMENQNEEQETNKSTDGRE